LLAGGFPALALLRKANDSREKALSGGPVEPPMPSAPARQEPPPGATVFVGPRPTITYVFEVVAQLNSGVDPVIVKARGLAIGKAVDVVEVVRHKFLDGAVAIGTIRIETERLVNRQGREMSVSSIAIPLSRSGPIPSPPAGRPPPTPGPRGP
jgi:archaea-specific DNA-binding protein